MVALAGIVVLASEGSSTAREYNHSAWKARSHQSPLARGARAAALHDPAHAGYQHNDARHGFAALRHPGRGSAQDVAHRHLPVPHDSTHVAWQDLVRHGSPASHHAAPVAAQRIAHRGSPRHQPEPGRLPHRGPHPVALAATHREMHHVHHATADDERIDRSRHNEVADSGHASHDQGAPSGHSGGHSFSGAASYYSEGQTVASGGSFNPSALTAAHRTLPFGTHLRVSDPKSGRSVVVTVNDRGPFVHGRVLDLSLGAARALGMTGRGVMNVTAVVE
jgi:rare lipoprotein A